MASTIASPAPQPPVAAQTTRKDLTSLQLHEEGRSTPLPQYQKTQSVPFNLTLQEDKTNPGQFQLVVDVHPQDTPNNGTCQKPADAKKLYANLQAFSSLGYDVSPLYQTKKSSPPTTPMSPRLEHNGWSDLDAIPPDFLQKVVPDWEVTFQRKDSTASTQSRKLADIKARIKKSGKGFVVRLLKGSSSDTNEVAEIHLGQSSEGGLPVVHELDSCPQAELDANETTNVTPLPQDSSLEVPLGVHEIGSSGGSGIPRQTIAPTPTPTPSSRVSAVPEWLRTTTFDVKSRNSISEEGFSDAETLAPEVRPFGILHDDEQSDLFPASTLVPSLPSRSTSISSIVKTPTRGLSVVGPVKRVTKGDRMRPGGAKGKGKAARHDLNRSDARKSIRRASHQGISSFSYPTTKPTTILADAAAPLQQPSSHSEHSDDSEENRAWAHPSRDNQNAKQRAPRQSSIKGPLPLTKQKAQLKLQTNVPRPKSANASPVTQRKKSPRLHKPSSSSSSVHFDEKPRHPPSPAWSEVDASEDLREAIKRAFGPADIELEEAGPSTTLPPALKIIEPEDEDNLGEIPMPLGLEIRSTPASRGSPVLTFWGLALSALSEKAFDALSALRLRYGSEPKVPHNHVRVRWTCSCGEPLYDDFIERRPGAARLLEAYLNRPRSHTPVSPSSRTSTSSTMSSTFSSVSTASTLATPASTYGGPTSWGKAGESSRFSPTRLRSNNPFSVRIGSLTEEQWLLTCANEGRFTPKIVHIDVSRERIKSDKDLALALREHYEQLNRGWLQWARLRGLTTIEFVQFEVHRNRFADIRASPSMPPKASVTSAKAPSEHPYSFEPIDLIPPVGSAYLLHLFKHPNDYDGEMITYMRSPKRRERLEFGMGWGINLVEGFLAQRVWLILTAVFGLGSGIFAVLWSIGKGDVQGAFGVAGWFVTLAGLVLGGLQAWLE